MRLEDLIGVLAAIYPETKVPLGFHDPYSYRGFYDQVAFEAKRDTTVGEMLSAAREALGSTYIGYKGGEFKMEGHTNCWLATYGYEGETIGPYLLRYMTGQYL